MPDPPPEDICATARARCAAIAAGARSVRIDPAVTPTAGGVAGLDPEVHLLDAEPEHRAQYVLILDAINFGSGWFGTLRIPAGADPTTWLSQRLTAHFRGRGRPWGPDELAALTAADVAQVLGQDAGHELMGLYTRSLADLGRWQAGRDALGVIAAAGGSARRFARTLAAEMPLFADHGFWKRAQITANDLVLAGVADFEDIDELTIFADNLVPHVLRLEGVLHPEPGLAARIDAGVPLAPGSPEEVELRACALHACENIAARLGVPPRTLDNWLWNRGLEERFRTGSPHLTRTVFY